eukprot:scaffold93548_cov33-Phaeocystis_antarctica.AAC.1
MHCDVTLAAKQLKCRPVSNPNPNPDPDPSSNPSLNSSPTPNPTPIPNPNPNQVSPRVRDAPAQADQQGATGP